MDLHIALNTASLMLFRIVTLLPFIVISASVLLSTCLSSACVVNSNYLLVFVPSVVNYSVRD